MNEARNEFHSHPAWCIFVYEETRNGMEISIKRPADKGMTKAEITLQNTLQVVYMKGNRGEHLTPLSLPAITPY